MGYQYSSHKRASASWEAAESLPAASTTIFQSVVWKSTAMPSAALCADRVLCPGGRAFGTRQIVSKHRAAGQQVLRRGRGRREVERPGRRNAGHRRAKGRPRLPAREGLLPLTITVPMAYVKSGFQIKTRRGGRAPHFFV